MFTKNKKLLAGVAGLTFLALGLAFVTVNSEPQSFQGAFKFPVHNESRLHEAAPELAHLSDNVISTSLSTQSPTAVILQDETATNQIAIFQLASNQSTFSINAVSTIINNDNLMPTTDLNLTAQLFAADPNCQSTACDLELKPIATSRGVRIAKINAAQSTVEFEFANDAQIESESTFLVISANLQLANNATDAHIETQLQELSTSIGKIKTATVSTAKVKVSSINTLDQKLDISDYLAQPEQ